MQHKILSRIFSLIAALACFLGYSSAQAALPFTIKPDHPRIYLDQARVDAIRAASLAPIPLNGTAFPQASGTLMFDILPAPRTSTVNQGINQPIFDNFNSTRNHFFVRHTDEVNPNTGKTYCNTDPTDTVNLCMQLAFQTPQGASYIAAKGFVLTASQWHTLSISWNSTLHTATLRIDGQPTSLTWTKDTASNLPVDWNPNGQVFVFTGRDKLDNIRVYDSDNLTTGNLIADFPMSEGVGQITSDASGNGIKALLAGVSWSARSVGGTDQAIQFDGQSGALMRIKPSSILTDAWRGTYALAVQYATSLNNNVSPVNINTGHQDSIAQVAHVIGLAWMVTREDRFRTAGLKYAELLITVPVTDGVEYSQAGRVEAMGIIYDWLFNVVNATILPDGRIYADALVDAVKWTVTATAPSGAMLGSMICGPGRAVDSVSLTCSGSSPTPTIQPYYIGGHHHSDNHKTAVALLAMVGERPEFENLLSAIHYNFINGFEPARAWISENGGHHMGWAYGGGYTYLLPAKLWDTATTDVNLRADWQGQLIYRYIYGLRGDALSFPASGDAFSSYTAGAETISEFALWSTSKFTDSYAQRFYESWNLPLKGGSRLNELLFWNGDIPSSPLEGLPYSRLFRNAGQVIMRDTWDYPNATLLEFKSTSFWSENHHHLDQNAFTIHYKTPLLIDSGYYGGADEYGSAHWQNYYTRTIAHNTLTIFDPSETFAKYATTYSNDGGQRFIFPYYPRLSDIQSGGTNHLDGVTAYEYTPNFTYTVGNASKAYSAGKLDQTNGFLRSLIFLRSPNFWAKPITVVFDKVTAASGKGLLVKRFLMHSVNEPLSAPGGVAAGPTTGSIMPGNTAVFQNGGGMLFSQTLLPENPVLTKVGGKDASGDYRFLAQVKDASGNYQYQNFGLTTAESDVAKNPDVGAWRVEVGTAAPTEREYFLNVLSIADNNGTVSAPPSAQNLPSPAAAVALLGGSQVVAFNKGDQPAASLSWNMPIADTKMLVAGLVPNAAYSGNIAMNGSSSLPYTVNLYQNQKGPLIASSQGVLAINSSVVSMGVGLAVNLTASPPTPLLINDPITYTLTITNNGPSDASGVNLINTLPAGTSFVSVNPSTGCTTGQMVACNLGNLANGTTATVTLVTKAITVGTKINTAKVSSIEFDPNTANNTATTTNTILGSCTHSSGFKISGKVTSSSTGRALSGATMNLIRPGTTPQCGNRTTTASDGTYQFTKLANGTYTVIPSKTGCTSFTPPNRSVSISNNNVSGWSKTGFAGSGASCN